MACRLCGSENANDSKINIFENCEGVKRQRLQLYVLLATGIQINEGDTVSKMVCIDCCHLVEKIYQYRVNSVSNNFLLHQRLEDSDSDCEIIEESTTLEDRVQIVSAYSLHTSVEELQNQYPNLVIPENVYGSDISPTVSLDIGEVEKWFANYDSLESQESESNSDTIENSVVVKVDVYQYESEEDDPMRPKTPVLNLIIKRTENRDTYEVINCIQDDEHDITHNESSMNSNSVLYNSDSPLRDTTNNNITETSLKHKRQEVPKNLRYHCQVCLKSYTKLKWLQKHQTRHLSCKFCKALIIHTQDLAIHEEECFRKIKMSLDKFQTRPIELKTSSPQTFIKHNNSQFPYQNIYDVPPPPSYESNHIPFVQNQYYDMPSMGYNNLAYLQAPSVEQNITLFNVNAVPEQQTQFFPGNAPVLHNNSYEYFQMIDNRLGIHGGIQNVTNTHSSETINTKQTFPLSADSPYSATSIQFINRPPLGYYPEPSVRSDGAEQNIWEYPNCPLNPLNDARSEE